MASEARATSGTVRLSFNSPPDFEAPGDEDGDNVYRLRAVNTHDINNINLEGNPTGCSGSVLDFTIRVQDVGVPAPPSIVNARFLESDDTMLEVSWSRSRPVLSKTVPWCRSPTGFEVNDYDYRYRPVRGGGLDRGSRRLFDGHLGHDRRLDRIGLRGASTGQ